jgi:hypothetical protein
MTRLQQEYIERAEEKMDQLEIVGGKAIRVIGSDSAITIPTTEELAAYIHEPEALRQIELIQEDSLQRAEEKVVIAEQSHSIVDNICKRLDSDLREMEKLLQVRSEYTASYFLSNFLKVIIKLIRRLVNSNQLVQRNQTI